MYFYETILNSVKYTVYFFSGFTGYFHPFTPVGPLALGDVYDSNEKTFYLAWYSENEKKPRLDFLEKYWLQFNEIEPVDIIKKDIGVYYFDVESKNNKYKIEGEISEKDTINKNIFYKYVVSKNGKIVESFIVKKILIDKYIYTYKSSGVFDNVDIILNDIPED